VITIITFGTKKLPWVHTRQEILGTWHARRKVIFWVECAQSFRVKWLSKTPHIYPAVHKLVLGAIYTNYIPSIEFERMIIPIYHPAPGCFEGSCSFWTPHAGVALSNKNSDAAPANVKGASPSAFRMVG
jgi:hypothetical protein